MSVQGGPCTGPAPQPTAPTGHIETCSDSSSYCQQVGGWHWTEMPSCWRGIRQLKVLSASTVPHIHQDLHFMEKSTK